MTDDNLATKVETSRRMEDDSIENNKEAGKKHKLPYIMYSQMYILNIHNSLSFSIEKEREGKISFAYNATCKTSYFLLLRSPELLR